METIPVINTARGFLLEGETDKALQILLATLSPEPRFVGSVRVFERIQANYMQVRQMEQKGVASTQEVRQAYSQVNDSLLAALDDLEAGRVPGPLGSRFPIRLWVAAGVLVLVLAGAAYWLRYRPVCPGFTETAPRILILPFQNVGISKDYKAEKVIQLRISDLSTKNKFPLEARVLGTAALDSRDPDLDAARTLCEHCDIDMVIWGLYDGSKDTAIQLTANYFFAQKDDEAGGTGFQSFRNITDLQQGKMLKSLDDAVFKLCGVMAIRHHNKALARKWFEKIKSPDAEERKVLEQLR
jgi:hypothetical protein